MLTQQEYLTLDATAMSSGLRNGDFTPSELIASAIEQAHKVNPAINALTSECYERAQRHAVEQGRTRDSHSAVAGLPFLIKDLSPLAGLLQSNGSRIYEGFIATQSAAIVQEYLNAGPQNPLQTAQHVIRGIRIIRPVAPAEALLQQSPLA